MKILIKEENILTFTVQIDVYNGITIDSKQIKNNKIDFEKNIDNLIKQSQNKYNLIWIYVHIKDAECIKILTSKEFIFHTCKENELLLVKRLKDDAIIPTAANHTLGVGVVVINDDNQLLVIKERISQMGYKLPGGHVDDKEMISKACVREVFEETGVSVEFENVVCLGHFYPHQFDKSNLYILCKAKAITSEINIIDYDEIEDAKWIDLDEYLKDESVLPFIKEIVKTAVKSKGFICRNEILDLKKEYELLFPKL